MTPSAEMNSSVRILSSIKSLPLPGGGVAGGAGGDLCPDEGFPGFWAGAAVFPAVVEQP